MKIDYDRHYKRNAFMASYDFDEIISIAENYFKYDMSSSEITHLCRVSLYYGQLKKILLIFPYHRFPEDFIEDLLVNDLFSERFNPTQEDWMSIIERGANPDILTISKYIDKIKKFQKSDDFVIDMLSAMDFSEKQETPVSFTLNNLISVLSEIS